MSKKIIAVNAGPRKGWNTDTLITEAARGAESVGAALHRLHLLLWLQKGKVQGPLRLPGWADAGIGCPPPGGRADHRLAQLSFRADGVLPRPVRAADFPKPHLSGRGPLLQSAAHSRAADTLYRHIGDISIHQCAGLIELILVCAAELMFKGLYLSSLGQIRIVAA